MARKRKAKGQAKTHDDQRPRKRFVGVRQRPSGRWVAEIKDTIQKIRLWLGTFDTAEAAARAYDEAACMLRGANTHTNFWPCCSSSTSALPPKIANLLLSKLKERNNSLATAAANDDDSSNSTFQPEINQQQQKQQEEVGDRVADFSDSTYADYLNYFEDNITDNNVFVNVSETTRDFSSITQNGYNQEFNIQPVNNNYERSNGEIIEIGELINTTDVEDIESNIDFQFLDEIGSCYYSPFDLTEELSTETMIYGEETSMLSEAMRRMSYERKFSASLYAFNGITECLKMKMKSGGVTRSEQLYRLQHACKRNLEKEKNGECNVGMTEKKDEENLLEAVPFSSMESSYDSEMSLWNSTDLPPICCVT